MFKRKSVDTILDKFQSTINELELHAQEKAKEADDIQARIDQALEDQRIAATEVDRATKAARKLTELFF